MARRRTGFSTRSLRRNLRDAVWASQRFMATSVRAWLHCRREHAGKGSIFRVFFPATHGSAAPETAVRPLHSTLNGHSAHTILVIDDEDGVRNVARLALERAGYKVIAATTVLTGCRFWSGSRRTFRSCCSI